MSNTKFLKPLSTSKNSFMEKLLDGVEVEWKTIGDVDFVEVANKGRKPVKASLRIPGETPYYGANNIQDYVVGYTHNGIYVLIAEDGSASLENYSVQYVTGKFWANNHIHVVRGTAELNTRFLFHYLRIVKYVPYLSGGGRAKLTKGKMLDIPIPIPPLEIQAEIVRILDTFTELTACKKQYSYYRDKLLSFDLPPGRQVEWKPMANVGEFFRGKRFTKADYVDDGISAIHYGEIYTQYDTTTTETVSYVRSDMMSTLRFAKPGDLVIAGVGETVEDVGKSVVWLGKENVTIHDDCFVFSHSLNPKFVSYYFQTTYL